MPLNLNRTFSLPEMNDLADYRADIEKWKRYTPPNNCCFTNLDIRGQFVLKSILNDAREASFIGQQDSFKFYEDPLVAFLDSKSIARLHVRFYDATSRPRLDERFDAHLASGRAAFSFGMPPGALAGIEVLNARMTSAHHSWSVMTHPSGLRQAFVVFNVKDTPGPGDGGDHVPSPVQPPSGRVLEPA